MKAILKICGNRKEVNKCWNECFFSLFWKCQKIKLFFQSHQKNWSVRFGGLSYGLLVSQTDVVQASKKFFLELVFSFLANWDFLKPFCAKPHEKVNKCWKWRFWSRNRIFSKNYIVVVALCLVVTNLVEKRLKWSKCGKRWKYSTVGKSGNLVIRSSLKSTRRVEKPLLHQLKNTPKQYFCDFHYIFFKVIFKKI